MHGARVIALRGNFDEALELVRELAAAPPDRARQLGQPVPPRGPEDGGVRDRRGARPSDDRRALHPGRQRGQHHRLLEGLPGDRPVARGCSASRPRAPRRSCSAHRVEKPETVASAIRIGNPARWEEAMAAVTAVARRASTPSPTSEILDAYRLLAAQRGRVLRARERGVRRRPAQARRRRARRASSAC